MIANSKINILGMTNLNKLIMPTKFRRRESNERVLNMFLNEFSNLLSYEILGIGSAVNIAPDSIYYGFIIGRCWAHH